MSLWSFLRGLWPWRKRPQPEPSPRPEAPAAPEAAPPEEAVAPTPAEAPPVADTPVEVAGPEVAEPREPPHEEIVELAEEPAEVAEPELEEPPAVEEEPEPATALEPEEALDEEEDEDGGWEDEDLEDPDAPDPFITGAVEAPPVDADLAELRAAARATALSGEQRIYMSMPAGPGSLTEALEQLAAEGLVTAEFVSDGEDGPHILYRPVAAPQRDQEPPSP